MKDKVGVAAVGCLMSIFLILAIPVGYLTYQVYMPHLMFGDPLTRQLYTYRGIGRQDGKVQIAPGLFEVGEPKQQVIDKLVGVGAREWPSGELPPGSSVETFRYARGAQNFACGSELYLTLHFEGDRLSSGTVHQGGVCL